MARSKVLDALSQITDELKNFERIARAIKPKPGSIPELDGIDVHGEIVPLNGIVGGDHLIVSRAPRKNGPRRSSKALSAKQIVEAIKAHRGHLRALW